MIEWNIGPKGRKFKAHGVNGYNAGCRCEVCTAGNRNCCYSKFADLRSRPREQVPHGTVGGYVNWGCRCRECTDAQTERCMEYYHRVWKHVIAGQPPLTYHGTKGKVVVNALEGEGYDLGK